MRYPGKFRLVTFILVDATSSTEDRGFVSSGVLSAVFIIFSKNRLSMMAKLIVISFRGNFEHHMTKSVPSSR